MLRRRFTSISRDALESPLHRALPGQAMIYLDNAATTPLLPEVREAMRPWLETEFANPSSAHSAGVAARRAIDEARRTVATFLHVPPDSIVFTSSGTEANNIAVKGLLLARPERKRHAVASAVEHPSVRHALESLRPLGAEVSWIRPRASGAVDPEEVVAAVRPETSLMAVIHGQNEYGALQPVSEIAALLRQRAPDVPLHVDAVQSFGKVPIEPKALGAATLALSAHKIHGPKGAGALVVLTRRPLWPLLSGGGQEGGVRSGTENVAAIVGFGRAVSLLGDIAAPAAKMAAMRQKILARLQEMVSGTHVVGGDAPSLPHIVSVRFDQVLGEVLLHHLDAEGIQVSRGSACQARKKDVSATFAALGMNVEQARSVIRISLSRQTTEAEVERLLEVLPRTVAHLREVGC
ncbi:MAG: cysteine desulfurase family protein [Planctomycetota bacterium]